MRVLRLDGLAGGELTAHCHSAGVLVIPRSIIRTPYTVPVPMSVEVSPNLEDLLVHGVQKKARDRICHDPESTIEGKSTNERRLGFYRTTSLKWPTQSQGK